jgi:hypothetical protein
VNIRGGDKLEAYLRELSAKVASASKVDVGFLEGATYPNGTPVATVAAYNEFGVPAHNQPPRPFFRNMIAEKSDAWGPTLGKLLVADKFDAGRALGQMGEGIAGQLRQSIKDTNEPPLSPKTVKRKGFTKPLVDTGVMLGSVDYEVSS